MQLLLMSRLHHWRKQLTSCRELLTGLPRVLVVWLLFWVPTLGWLLRKLCLLMQRRLSPTLCVEASLAVTTHLGVSGHRGQYSTLNSRILIIKGPK